MKKEKKNKKRNRIIFLLIGLVYFVILVYLIITVEKPQEIKVTPETASITMDGVSKLPIKVVVFNSKSEPMSGQKISYQFLEGSGKVTVVRGITLEDGISLGEYTAGYGSKEQIAKVLISNETGLSKTLIITELPSLALPGQIIINADTQKQDILSSGLEIEALLLDITGKPMINHKLLFKVDKGNGGFQGFRMMSKATNGEGIVVYKFETKSAGEVVITVESEEDKSISKTIKFTVQE